MTLSVIGAAVGLLTLVLIAMYYGIGTIETDEDVKGRWLNGPREKKRYKARHRRTWRNFRLRLPTPPYLRNMGQHTFG